MNSLVDLKRNAICANDRVVVPLQLESPSGSSRLHASADAAKDPLVEVQP